MKLLTRTEAIALRQQGKSIKTIADKLSVSTGSVSRWCRKIHLSDAQRSRLDIAQRAIAKKTLKPWITERRNGKIKDLRAQANLAKSDVKRILQRDLLMFGLGLYWGEGYKRGSDEWGFTNSDPFVIRTMLAWLSKCYGVEIKRIIARLTLNSLYSAEAKRIMKQWVLETKIPLSQFGPVTFISGYGKSKLSGRTYRGTLRIKVRNGTSLRRRILASIAETSFQVSSNSRKTAS